MDHLLQEAVRVAIVTEKNCLDFYRSAAAKVRDGSVRRLFERFTDDLARRLELFLGHYPGSEFGDLHDMLAGPPNLNNPRHRALQPDMAEIIGEKEALELALQEEELCSEYYSVLMEAIRVPGVHAVFQTAMEDTLRHCQDLRKEYQNIMKKGWSDQAAYVRE